MIKKILPALEQCAQEISLLITQDNRIDYAQAQNISGDKQLKLDIKADKVIAQILLNLDCIQGICSEEKEEAMYKESGEYFVAYDPLDGSSIIDSNLSVGSIFGIYQGSFQASSLVGAAYIIYGPRLELVFADKTTEVFRQVFAKNNWIKLPSLQLKQSGKINAPGGTQKYWKTKHKELIDGFFTRGYRLRYSGGMVPDLHQILIKGGGIFSYPATIDAPKGKLRKLFEVFPFAFIYEKAGGEAIDGRKKLLELDVVSLHDTTPCFFGSKDEIEQVKQIYQENL